MIRTYKIQLTQAHPDSGPFDIYHTSETPANLLFSGLSRASLVAGDYFNIDDGYSQVVIVDNSACSNDFTITL